MSIDIRSNHSLFHNIFTITFSPLSPSTPLSPFKPGNPCKNTTTGNYTSLESDRFRTKELHWGCEKLRLEEQQHKVTRKQCKTRQHKQTFRRTTYIHSWCSSSSLEEKRQKEREHLWYWDLKWADVNQSWKNIVWVKMMPKIRSLWRIFK